MVVLPAASNRSATARTMPPRSANSTHTPFEARAERSRGLASQITSYRPESSAALTRACGAAWRTANRSIRATHTPGFVEQIDGACE